MLETIVILDDSEADRYLVHRTIERARLDVRVVQYSTALEAVEDFTDETRFVAQLGESPPPVLVLLDINMPRMNGFEFLERLQKEGASKREQVVVMMLTSSNNPAERERAKSFDLVVDFLEKPISAEQLLSIAQRPEFTPNPVSLG